MNSIIVLLCLLVAASKSVDCENELDLLHSNVVRQLEVESDFIEPVDNEMNFVKIFTGLYYEGPYSTINSHLVDNVPVEADYKANIAEAKKLLDKERQRKVYGLNIGLIEALEQFVALEKTMKVKIRCTRRSYPALVKNDRAVKGVAHKPRSERFTLRRVDWVIAEVFERHAFQCQSYYINAHGRKRHDMDKDKLSRVDLFTTNIILGSRHKALSLSRGEDETIVTDLIQAGAGIEKMKGGDIGEAVYRTLNYLATDDGNLSSIIFLSDEKRGKKELDKEGISRLLDTFLFKPCEYYAEQLGPDVFIPAKFDAAVLEKKDRYQWDSPQDRRFILDMIRYRFCTAITTNDKQDLIKDVLKVASKLNS